MAQLRAAFRDLDGVVVYGPNDGGACVATLSINIQDVSAEQAGTMLDADYHICVRTGLHCAPLVHEDQHTVEQKGTIRFSPGYFTDEDDVEQAIKGVTELVGMLVRT